MRDRPGPARTTHCCGARHEGRVGRWSRSVHGTCQETMMATTRRADATWAGDLLSGNGTVTAATTGVFASLPTTWASRIGEPEGVTSPEELLASAHASCFSMAFSNELAKAGTPPTKVTVSVAVAGDKLETGWTVLSSAITVSAVVSGATEASLQEAA